MMVRSRVGWLLAVYAVFVALAASFGSGRRSEAAPSLSDGKPLSLHHRVERVRSAMGQAAAEPESGRQRVAQWLNWPNWPNMWTNWANY